MTKLTADAKYGEQRKAHRREKKRERGTREKKVPFSVPSIFRSSHPLATALRVGHARGARHCTPRHCVAPVGPQRRPAPACYYDVTIRQLPHTHVLSHTHTHTWPINPPQWPPPPHLRRPCCAGPGDLETFIACVVFVLISAARFDVDSDTLSNELQQLGLPRGAFPCVCPPAALSPAAAAPPSCLRRAGVPAVAAPLASLDGVWPCVVMAVLCLCSSFDPHVARTRVIRRLVASSSFLSRVCPRRALPAARMPPCLSRRRPLPSSLRPGLLAKKTHVRTAAQWPRVCVRSRSPLTSRHSIR